MIGGLLSLHISNTPQSSVPSKRAIPCKFLPPFFIIGLQWKLVEKSEFEPIQKGGKILQETLLDSVQSTL